MLKARANTDQDTCAFGDKDLAGITEEEIDLQCDEIFKNTPIKFVPRKNNELDLAIALII